jgi:hypothetical protein
MLAVRRRGEVSGINLTIKTGDSMCTMRVVAFLLFGAASFLARGEESGAAAYRQAFYSNISSTLTQVLAQSPEAKQQTPEALAATIAKLAEGFTDCHMRSLDLYPPSIQEVAFSAIQAGGSYADAKEALNRALAAEGAAGGEREAAVSVQIQKAVEFGLQCMKAVQSGATSG